MNRKERIKNITGKASESSKRFVRKSMDLADRISEVLEMQEKTQKDLAKALGKSESEISKWLSGQHNFTVRTLSTIEAALGVNIYTVPGGKRQRRYYSERYPTGELGKLISDRKAPASTLSGLKWDMNEERADPINIPDKLSKLPQQSQGNSNLPHVA